MVFRMNRIGLVRNMGENFGKMEVTFHHIEEKSCIEEARGRRACPVSSGVSHCLAE